MISSCIQRCIPAEPPPIGFSSVVADWFININGRVVGGGNGRPDASSDDVEFTIAVGDTEFDDPEPLTVVVVAAAVASGSQSRGETLECREENDEAALDEAVRFFVFPTEVVGSAIAESGVVVVSSSSLLLRIFLVHSCISTELKSRFALCELSIIVERVESLETEGSLKTLAPPPPLPLSKNLEEADIRLAY